MTEAEKIEFYKIANKHLLPVTPVTKPTEKCSICNEDPCVCEEDKDLEEAIKEQESTYELPPKVSALRAIRNHCLNQCALSRAEVTLCQCNTCDLYPFRKGKNPFRIKRIMTDEQREASKIRLAKARDAKGN